MTVSMNSKAPAFYPLSDSNNRERAEAFVNKTDRELSRTARHLYGVANKKNDEKLAKRTSFALKALPVIAVAAGLATKKGLKPSLLDGALWGTALAVPAVVDGANKVLTKNDNIKKAEKRHPGMAFGLELGAVVAGFYGARNAIVKIAKNKSVNKVFNSFAEGVKNTYEVAKKEIKVPKRITELAEKVKVPETVRNMYHSIAESSIGKGAASLGKKAVKYAPEIVLLGTIAAIFTAGAKNAARVNNIKNQLKQEQMDTAKDLADYYKQQPQDDANAQEIDA